MAYHGVVSKGCEACRSRKVKCDRGQPACDRCNRSGRRCPGYRELTTVIFRNENRRIVRRFVKKQSGSKACAADEHASTPKGVSTQDLVQYQSAGQEASKVDSGRDMKALPLQQQQKQQLQQGSSNQAIVALPSVRIGRNEAVCFFHQQFAWETVPMHFALSSQTSRSPALLNTTAALGLAMLSFKRCSPLLEREAYAEYGSALQLVNSLLSSRATVAKDTTLAVVVLMSFFEIFTSHSAPSMKSWTNHASGAARILGIRGPSQLDSPLGYQLFLETKGTVLAASLIYKTPMPQILSDYTQIAMEREPQSLAHAGRIFIILFELANLRAAIESHTITSPLEIRRAVHGIESQLRHWRAILPSDWEYEIITLEDSDGAVETRCGKVRPYGGRYFVYSKVAPYVAVGWLNYYISQILVGEVFLSSVQMEILGDIHCMQKILWAECWAVRQNMDLMAGAICASIPWLLGFGPPTDESLGVEGGCMILLPLWFAACVEGADHPLRHNALLLFDIVAQRVGIAHASLHTRELVRMAGMTEWLDDPLQSLLLSQRLDLTAANPL